MLVQIEVVWRWYAVGGPPTARRQVAALAELAISLVGGPTCSPGTQGRVWHWYDTRPRDTVHERAAQLCITAGADMTSPSAGAANAALAA